MQPTLGFLNLPAYQMGCELQSKLLSVLIRIPPNSRLAVGKPIWTAASAVTANLVEGLTRPSSYELTNFCRTSIASLERLRRLLPELSRNGYLNPNEFQTLVDLTVDTTAAIEEFLNESDS